MASRSRKIVTNTLRVVVCLGALWFVARGVTLRDHLTLKSGDEVLVGSVQEQDGGFLVQFSDGTERRVDRSEVAVDNQEHVKVAYGLLANLTDVKKPLLLLAFVINFPVVFLQALRLKCLLAAQKIHIAYRECVKFSFAGNFLNFATPLGSNAGDVFKAYFVSTHTDQKTEAITTIVLDRVIGLGTVIASVALISAFVPADSRVAEFRPFVLTVFAIGVVGLIAYLSPFVGNRLFAWRWIQRLPMYEQLRRIDTAVRQLFSHRLIVTSAVMMTVVLQATAIAAYVVVAIAISMDAGLHNVLEYYAYFYTGTVIQALPGPPQGLGTVELAYRYFFSSFGGASQIVCMALVIRVVAFSCSLPGLLITATGSYRPSAAIPTTTAPSVPQHQPKRDMAIR